MLRPLHRDTQENTSNDRHTMERNIARKEASRMDGSIGNPGLSSTELAQVIPSVSAIAREAHVALQHAGAASSGPQKPGTSAETRQGKGSKGLVEEVAFANAIAEFLNQQVSFRRLAKIICPFTLLGAECNSTHHGTSPA